MQRRNDDDPENDTTAWELITRVTRSCDERETLHHSGSFTAYLAAEFHVQRARKRIQNIVLKLEVYHS